MLNGSSRIKVASLFTSVDGEVNRYGQGTFTRFIRLQGCNLQCDYCDTRHAQNTVIGGDWMLVDEVVRDCHIVGVPKVTLTGGEPMIQPNTPVLLEMLSRQGFLVTVETNGTCPIIPMNNVNWVVDFKLPSSGMRGNMPPVVEMLKNMAEGDFIKFVIGTPDDYEEAMNLAEEIHERSPMVGLAFSAVADSPSFGIPTLVDHMVRDKLFYVKLNTQIHKWIWPDAQISGVEV